MNRVLTWAEFRDELKTEAGIQTTAVNDDALLLALANEALVQCIATGKSLRDFRIDQTFVLLSTLFHIIDTLFIAEIDQMYYQVFSDGVYQIRYDLIEQSGIVGPAPPLVSGLVTPTSYTIKADADADPTKIQTVIVFYPIGSGKIGDKIQIVGSGFKQIIDNTTLMPYFTLYSWIKLNVFERYAAKRNLDPQKVMMYAKMLDRAAAIATVATVDDANVENPPK